jgi:hypothetical protein
VEVPKWITDRIAAVDPYLRLGYVGGEHFVVLSLTRPRELATLPVAPATWDGKGPIFGAPFDQLAWQPVEIADVACEQVFSDLGDVLQFLQRSLTPLRQRAVDDGREESDWYERAVTDLAGEMGDYLRHRSNLTGHSGSVPIAKKHLSMRDRDILSGDHSARNHFKEALIPEWAK